MFDKIKPYVLALALVANLAGCTVTVPMATEAEDQLRKTFSVSQDKAGLYIFSMTKSHYPQFFINERYYNNGVNLYRLGYKTYTFQEISPGTNFISTIGSAFSSKNKILLSINAEAGQNYFVQVTPHMGMWTWYTTAKLVSEDVGKESVLMCKLSRNKGFSY